MPMTIRDEPAVDAIALLTIPSLDRMSEQQLRGYVCVWGGEALTAGVAVNLGPRKKKRLGGEYEVYPQGCPTCVEQAALSALFDHTDGCDICRESPTCATGRALNRLIRQANR